MKRLLSLLILFDLVIIWIFAQVSVQKLLTENRVDPIGIDVPIPVYMPLQLIECDEVKGSETDRNLIFN